jgi:beta-glucanase (GH16 family)
VSFRKICVAIAAALAVTIQISTGPALATTSSTTPASLSAAPGVAASLEATALALMAATGIEPASGSSTPTSPSTVPGAPTAAAATAITSGAMVWWAAPNPVASPVTGYIVTPYLGPVALAGITFPSTATAEAVTGLVEGQSYTFTVAAINAIGAGQASGRTQSLTIVDPALTFDDEFTGPAGADANYGMSQRYWMLDPCWKSGCAGSPTAYSSNNSYLDGNGNLVLQADQGATGMCGSVACQYTSAGLTMLDWANGGQPTWSQQYGTFSARIKMPVGRGLWPAFWLEGSNDATVGWPASGEIDGVEAHGQDPQSVSGHAIGSADGTSESLNYGGSYTLPDAQDISGWHTYSVTWSPYGIVWQVDGTTMLTMSAAQAGPSWARSLQHPFSILLDLTVGGPTVGLPDASTVFPAKMLVDYVRAWS